MSIDYPNFSGTHCLRLSIDGDASVTPAIKKEIIKIASEKRTIRTIYSQGEVNYYSSLKIGQNQDASEGLDFEITFSTRVPIIEQGNSEIFNSIINIIELNKIKLSMAQVTSTFRYSLDNYESLIQLPLPLPLPNLSETDKPEIRGIRLSLTDPESGKYNHTIDLYGKNVFHDISIFIKEKEITQTLFTELLNKLNDLSNKLIKQRSP